jgi:hypothetical protein
MSEPQLPNDPEAILAQCEDEIEKAESRSAWVIGQNLRKIRDSRLYFASNDESFERYCARRWGFSKQHSYRLINFFEVCQILRLEKGQKVTRGLRFRATERVLRPLTRLRRDAEEDEDEDGTFNEKAILEVWNQWVEGTGRNGAITAKDVERAVAAYLGEHGQQDDVAGEDDTTADEDTTDDADSGGEQEAEPASAETSEDEEQPEPKQTNRQGYVTPDRDKKTEPDLLEAVGKLVAFTPTAAKKCLANNPHQASKIKHALPAARAVLDALDEQRRPEVDVVAELTLIAERLEVLSAQPATEATAAAIAEVAQQIRDLLGGLQPVSVH